MRVKLKKLVHSCLYLEVDGVSTLIDPGEYSEGIVEKNLEELKRVDYLLITHEHFDHLHLPTVKKLVNRNESIKIIAPLPVVKILDEIHVKAQESGDENVSLEFAKHEKLFDRLPPENISFTIKNTLTHPGDSLSFKKSAGILSLPIQAPWGSTVWAVEKALEMRPQYVLPIHDWHWKEEVLSGMYDRLDEFFSDHSITFLNPVKTPDIELSL